MNGIFPIAVSIVLALYSWHNVSWRLQRNPELKGGYLRLLMLWLLWINSGFLFRLLPENPLTAYIVWLPIALIAIWILGLGGANFLQSYPGILFIPVGSARRIRFYTVLYLVVTLLLSAMREFDLLHWRQNDFVLPFPLIFVAMWFGVSFALAAFSGWQWLSENYPLKGKFPGNNSGWISGNMCGVTFRSCLVVAGDDAGFYMRMTLLFRLGHPPLFIPWSDIVAAPRRILWWDSTVLEFRKSPGVLLSLSPEDFAPFLSRIKGNHDPSGILDSKNNPRHNVA
ncbi:MAG: hypothetical protein JNM27_03335 [Leptospirales bacterium]|nr:hypothetical protein [Leptospirales bacterium]